MFARIIAFLVFVGVCAQASNPLNFGCGPASIRTQHIILRYDARKYFCVSLQPVLGLGCSLGCLSTCLPPPCLPPPCLPPPCLPPPCLPPPCLSPPCLSSPCMSSSCMSSPCMAGVMPVPLLPPSCLASYISYPLLPSPCLCK